MIIDTTGNWQLYWGPGPLPEGATGHGVVTRQGGVYKGALILLASGQYVQGNAGAYRTLDQRLVKTALG